MNYYRGPWKLVKDEAFPDGYWSPPEGCVSAVDLRTLPEQGQIVSAQGEGVFATDTHPGTGYTEFPTEEAATDHVWKKLTDDSDPRGLTAPKPLMPCMDRCIKLRFNGKTRKERIHEQHKHFSKVRDVIRENYRQVKNQDDMDFAVHRKRKNLHRKYLDYVGQKLGVENPEDHFIPEGLPREKRLKHETTHTESFDGADNALVGKDLTWTEGGGGFQNLNNRAYGGSAGATDTRVARAEHDVSSEDHYVEAELVVRGNFGGVLARMDASAFTTCYFADIQSATISKLWKIVADTHTGLGQGDPPNDGGVIKLTCDGSTISHTADGVEMYSVTDTAITGNLRGGLYAFSSTQNNQFDDWEISDLAAAGGGNALMTLMGVG